MRPYDSLRTRADFARVRRRGRRFEGTHLSLLAAPSAPGRRPRVAIVTAKTVGGAVQRNRARRRIRAVVDGIDGTGFDLVLTARPSAGTVPFEGLRDEIARLVGRLRP